MDLNTSIDFLKGRVDKTRSVEAQIAPTWAWPLKTVAQWGGWRRARQGRGGQPRGEGGTAHTAAEAARGDLDTRLAAIHAVTVSVVGVMRVRAQRQPELAHVVEELSARGDSRKGIEDEGAALLSAWKLEFDGAAFVPAPGVTYEGLRELFYGRAADAGATPPVTALASLRELKEAYSDAATIDRRETGRLNVRLALVERDCVDWYAEATKVFVAGTEIGDLIRSEVPTGADYNPPARTAGAAGHALASGACFPPRASRSREAVKGAGDAVERFFKKAACTMRRAPLHISPLSRSLGEVTHALAAPVTRRLRLVWRLI